MNRAAFHKSPRLLLILQFAAVFLITSPVCGELPPQDGEPYCATATSPMEAPWLTSTRKDDEEKLPLSHSYETSRRCRGVNAVMVLQDCAKGPYGKNKLLREQMEAVFGKYTCFSLFYGYLTVSDLKEYDVIYIDGSGEDFPTVSDWLSRGDLKRGGAAFLEEFAQKGQTIWFNAAPKWSDLQNHTDEYFRWSLPYGAQLELQKNDNHRYGIGGIIGGSYRTNTNVYRGKMNRPEDLYFTERSVTADDTHFAHGSIGSLSSHYLPLIVTKDKGLPILVSGIGTASNVFLSTMTPSDMHSPQPDVTNLRLNILESLCGGKPTCVSYPQCHLDY